MATPWKPRKTMSSSKVRHSPQPRVKAESRVVPRMRMLRRPITSAMAPEINSVQPDVRLERLQLAGFAGILETAHTRKLQPAC
jgi:hypothetical protein